MLIFWRERLVFLATPKTASTAIEQALEPLAAMVVLRPPVLKHTNAHRFRRFLSPYLASASGHDFELCALMREPRDWLGSWYRYRQRKEEVAEKSTSHLSFDAFVQAYCRDDRPEFANVGNQANFLAPNGKAPVDHIFRYEEIDRFVAFLEDRLDCAITLPRVNVSPPGETALPAATEALLCSFCARDFEIYAGLSAR